MTRTASTLAILLIAITAGAGAQEVVDATTASGAGAPASPSRPGRIDPRYQRAPMHVALARLAWVESTTEVTPEEQAALYEVIATRTTTSWRRTAWRYSFGLRHPRRRYVQRLGDAPVRTAPRYVRERWPVVLEGARRVVAGDVTHGCNAPAPLVHFGGRHADRDDIRRKVRQGFVVADCPGHFLSAFLYDGNARRRAAFARRRGR